MGCQSEVMHWYEQIAPLTERMLMLARLGHWGELPALEAMQSDIVDRLKVIEPDEELSESQKARKYQLLSRIIASQAEISKLVMPQLEELQLVLKNMTSQQLLQQTYGRSNEPVS